MNARGLSRCQRQLLEELGDQYSVNRIDGANCIYRDFGDHDVEICGGRTKRALYHIFVWQKKPGMEIVERFMDLPHDDDLVVDLLGRIAMKYDGAMAGESMEDGVKERQEAADLE